jgi:hypothetical protein
VSNRTPSWAEYNAFQLAALLDCAGPDSPESPGAQFLNRVRNCLLDYFTYTKNEDQGIDDIYDTIWEIADSSVNVYTFPMWQEFVDLALWQDEVEYLDNDDDMTRIAMRVMYRAAERLCHALLAEDNPFEDDDA